MTDSLEPQRDVGIQFKLMENGKAPKRMSTGDIGYDLCAAKRQRFNCGDSYVVPLGVAFGIPQGCYGVLTHRSSLAFKKGMICSLGIIDSSFTGEVKAKIFNLSGGYQWIDEGDRICQIIFKKKVDSELFKVDNLIAGKEGFGSSGVK